MRQKRAKHAKQGCTNTRWDDRARRFRDLQTAPAAQRRRLMAEWVDRPASAGRARPRSSPAYTHRPGRRVRRRGGSENLFERSLDTPRMTNPAP